MWQEQHTKRCEGVRKMDSNAQNCSLNREEAIPAIAEGEECNQRQFQLERERTGPRCPTLVKSAEYLLVHIRLYEPVSVSHCKEKDILRETENLAQKSTS